MTRAVVAAAAFLVLLATANPAAAFNWSVGANAGIAVLLPTAKNLENKTEFAWTSSGLTPGLRFGFTGERPQHEFYLETGLSYTSTKNDVTKSSFSATGNYQYNFSVEGNMVPYVTAGGGLLVARFKNLPINDSATSGIFGGGVGLRHKMGNGHGALRLEVRYDRQTEGKDGSSILINEGNLVSGKVGFDLWDK